MKRDSWSSTFGFFVASVGCAIGLGNIWLFPWRLGEYGSASFLIPYLIFTFVFVYFGLMGELAFGRATQRGTIGAFKRSFAERKRGWAYALGGFQVLAQAGITVFYFIALGWIIRYTWIAIAGGFGSIEPLTSFDGFVGTGAVVPWHVLAVVITATVVLLGVSRGIEVLNRAAIPGLFILFAVLLVRSLTLPGAMEGLAQLLQPKFDNLWRLETWIMALGQSFFTVSLGGMLIYGSYLKKETDIPATSFWVVTTNLFASLLAALIIIPAAISFGIDPGRGPGLLFVSLPQVFNLMPAGHLFGALFFVSVLLAGLSSAVNLLEVPVEGLMELTGLKRSSAAIAVSAATLVIGLPLTLDMRYFGLWTDLVTIYFYPAGVLVIAVVAQWAYGAARIREEINLGARRPVGSWLGPHLRYVFVAVCLLVMVLNIVYGGIG